MGTELAKKEQLSIVEQVIAQGDLKSLSPDERAHYYSKVCESLGLNPFTKPFEYIILNGKLTLYARKDATDQMRQNKNISISITAREKVEDLYIVSAKASDPLGRTDEAIGVVSIAGLKGDMLANALMKAETKAKRRVTLSICGLGWTDESEIETIPAAQRINVDYTTGEIIEQPAALPPNSYNGNGNGNGEAKSPSDKQIELAKKLQLKFHGDMVTMKEIMTSVLGYAGIIKTMSDMSKWIDFLTSYTYVDPKQGAMAMEGAEKTKPQEGDADYDPFDE